MTRSRSDLIAEETGGKSLEANVALTKNNARAGAQLAVALAQRPNRKAPLTHPPGMKAHSTAHLPATQAVRSIRTLPLPCLFPRIVL